MAWPLVSDQLRATVEAFLPAHETSELGEWPQVGERTDRTGILFLLRLAQEMRHLPRIA